MSIKYTLAMVALSMTLLASQARAEAEGNGDPFPFRVFAQTYNVGQPSVEVVEAPLHRQTASLAMNVLAKGTTNQIAVASRPISISLAPRSNLISK